MSSRDLSDIDRDIARLQAERKRREEELADPKRQEIRRLYEDLDRILDRLDELGEDVVTDENQVVTILGTSFYYVHGVGIRER